MRIIVLVNPLSGRGRAEAEGQRVHALLAKRRYEVESVALGPGALEGDFSQRLADAGAVVIVGGDGTVQACAGVAAHAHTPVYHWPTGTENLFAREFTMTRDEATLLARLESMETEHADLGVCNGRLFVLMGSVGPDASVVHRLARTRGASITHMSYARHVIREMLTPLLTPLTVRVDGEEIISHRPGMVFVANSRQYALRIDPAKDASMTDGLLDIVHFPVSSRLGLLKWMGLARARQQTRFRGATIVRGKRIEIENNAPAVPYQLDGEAAGMLGVRQDEDAAIHAKIEIGIAGHRLVVLSDSTA